MFRSIETLFEFALPDGHICLIEEHRENGKPVFIQAARRDMNDECTEEAMLVWMAENDDED